MSFWQQTSRTGAELRAELIAAGLLVPIEAARKRIESELDMQPCLRLDDAGRARAARAVAGKTDDARELGQIGART